jgi:ABC-type bacteriocin/lantibiotic exporter with double-glycine peptidase domain
MTNDKNSRSAIKDFYRYIWSVSARSQIILTVLSVAVFLLQLAPLELQRRIVNGAVEHREFRYLAIAASIYVLVALTHGVTKLGLNVYRASVSEAANKRLRMQVDPTGIEAASDPNGAGQRGVKISIVVSEVEAVGNFIGSSFCDPVLNAGILLSVWGYMLVIQPAMAGIAFLIFSPQLIFIPFLQKAINRRTKRRIKTVRALSSDLVEAAVPQEGGTKHVFHQRIRDIYRLNVQILARKFGMNFLMNLCYTLGVIAILITGGWLVLQGRTEVGTIVAFISGLERMNGPWGELVNYFRDLTNSGLKFRMIAAEFKHDEMPAEVLDLELLKELRD